MDWVSLQFFLVQQRTYIYINRSKVHMHSVKSRRGKSKVGGFQTIPRHERRSLDDVTADIFPI